MLIWFSSVRWTRNLSQQHCYLLFRVKSQWTLGTLPERPGKKRKPSDLWIAVCILLECPHLNRIDSISTTAKKKIFTGERKGQHLKGLSKAQLERFVSTFHDRKKGEVTSGLLYNTVTWRQYLNCKQWSYSHKEHSPIQCSNTQPLTKWAFPWKFSIPNGQKGEIF